MTLEELLKLCKSLRTIEGDAVPKFLEERRKKMEEEGISGSCSLSSHKSGRTVLTKTVPTGFQIKGMAPVTMEQAKKWADTAGVAWEEGFGSPSVRVIPWRMSDERPDRHGDIVRQNFAWTNFALNPVLLDAHRWEDLPIGNVIQHELVQVASTEYNGPATNGMCLFATLEMNPKADIAYRLARAKLLRAGSIGFFPMIITYVEDQKEREGLGLGRWGVILEKSEMAEFSPCSVPANPGAIQNRVTRAAKSKLIIAKDLDAVHDIIAAGKHLYLDDAAFKATDDALTKVFKDCFPELTKTTSIPPTPMAEKSEIVLLQEEVKLLRGELREVVAMVSTTAKGLKEGLASLYENQQQIIKSETDDDEVDPADPNADSPLEDDKDDEAVDLEDLDPDADAEEEDELTDDDFLGDDED